MKDATTEVARYRKGLTSMRGIALFLISSILNPATLASGQVPASQVKIETALPSGGGETSSVVISNIIGGCLAMSVNVPLRPIRSQQTIAPPLMAKKPKLAVMQDLVWRLGWEDHPQRAVSLGTETPRLNYDGSRGFNVAHGVDPSYASFSAERDNAVVRF